MVLLNQLRRTKKDQIVSAQTYFQLRKPKEKLLEINNKLKKE